MEPFSLGPSGETHFVLLHFILLLNTQLFESDSIMCVGHNHLRTIKIIKKLIRHTHKIYDLKCKHFSANWIPTSDNKVHLILASDTTTSCRCRQDKQIHFVSLL